MSPNGDIHSALPSRPTLSSPASESKPLSTWHYLVIAGLGMQAYSMTPNVQWTTSTAEWIVGILLTILSIVGWVFWVANSKAHKDNVAYTLGGPVVLTILSSFSGFFLYGFVWDALCPDDDADDCESEATVIFVTFAMFFLCLLYTVVCFYNLINRLT